MQVELTTPPPLIIKTTRSLNHETKLKFEPQGHQYPNLHAKPDTGIESHIATQNKSAPYGHMLNAHMLNAGSLIRVFQNVALVLLSLDSDRLALLSPSSRLPVASLSLF